MRTLTLASILTLCTCSAADAENLALTLAKRNDRDIALRFSNESETAVELEMPVEGAGDCDRYFKIEAVTEDGSAVRRTMLYAPALPPYVVKLRPRNGIYVHQIRPQAYLGGIELKKLQQLRVQYVNPLTGNSILSDWLNLGENHVGGSAPADDDGMIVPGLRVGPYVLGRSALADILGQDAPKRRKEFARRGLYFTFDRGGLLTSVTIDVPAPYATHEGFRVGSEEVKIRAKLGQPCDSTIRAYAGAGDTEPKFTIPALVYDGVAFGLEEGRVTAIAVVPAAAQDQGD